MNHDLAAHAIGVMVLILKETEVPKDRIREAFEWALDNVGEPSEWNEITLKNYPFLKGVPTRKIDPDTPRANAIAKAHACSNKDYHYRWQDYERLARQLESELAEARDDLKDAITDRDRYERMARSLKDAAPQEDRSGPRFTEDTTPAVAALDVTLDRITLHERLSDLVGLLLDTTVPIGPMRDRKDYPPELVRAVQYLKDTAGGRAS